jgi:LmbE family N-acetylglucosaminyl deacetylase
MRRLLAIVPHPDDEAYSFGGTLALAAAAGWSVTVFAMSAGDRGECHTGEASTPEALADLRLAELAASCRALGVEPGPSPRLPDGGLAGHPGLVPAVDACLRTATPDIVVTLGPDGAYGHPDHLALHRAVVAAIGARPEPPALLFAAFPRGLFAPQYERCRPLLGDPPPLLPADLGTDTPDFRIPISAVADRKRAALAAHRSQLPGGDPEAIFPPGIVPALLHEEWFVLPCPGDMARVARLLLDLESAS